MSGLEALTRGRRLLARLRRKITGRASVDRRLSPALSVPPEDIERFRGPMYAYWSSLGHPPATCEMFLRDAFNIDGYVDAVARALRHMGGLRGKKVLDVGCGWGGLSRVLAERGAEVTMVDPHPPHVEIARMRVPQAMALANEQFDHVFVYSVIEHVGLPPDHRGDAGPVLEIQRKLILEAARVLKPGGVLMVSTGNYLFPYDGEVQIWFFHYLPEAVQKELLQAIGRSADRYGLLSWSQLLGMTEAAGLTLAHVETCETEGLLRTMEGWLSGLSGAASASADRRSATERIRTMVTTDPNWMPMWHAFFRKPG
jgi:cyclopropane fatty-acyl-phospholipid synthase-like methyltransferase